MVLALNRLLVSWTAHVTSAALVLAPALSACADWPGRVSPAGSVDTLASGVVVVRNTSRQIADQGDWQLERIASISGTGRADSPADFEQVTAIAISPDSLLYVLDGQAKHIGVFTLAGTYVRTIARAGSGPGELMFPVTMSFDTSGRLWIGDEGLRRYTVFDGEGAPVASYRRPFRWAPWMRGGQQFATDGLLSDLGSRSGRRMVVRMRIDTSLVVQDSIAVPSLDPRMLSTTLASGEVIGIPVPYTPQQAYAIGARGEVWTGSGSTYQIALLGTDGDTLRLVELDVPPPPLSPGDRLQLDSVASEARKRGYRVDPVDMPAHHPFFQDLLVSDTGELWVRRALPGESVAAFDVFSTSGLHQATVRAAADLYPRPQVLGDLFVATQTDSMGVQRVNVYRVNKAPR